MFLPLQKGGIMRSYRHVDARKFWYNSGMVTTHAIY